MREEWGEGSSDVHSYKVGLLTPEEVDAFEDKKIKCLQKQRGHADHAEKQGTGTREAGSAHKTKQN